MVTVAGVVIGALLGWFNARRKGGKALDQAHQAGIGAMIFGTLAIFVVIVIDRMN